MKRAAVDSHIHLFRNGFGGERAAGADLAAFEALHATTGIEGVFVVGYEGEPRFLGNNEHIAELADSRPWLHPLFYLDSSADPGHAPLAAARERGHAGFSLYLDEPGASLDEWAPTTLAALAHASAVVSVNAGPAAIARHSGALARLSDGFVLVSHLGLPGRPASTAGEARAMLRPLLELARCEHVFVKVSGLYAIDPRYPHLGAIGHLEVLLEAFGPERLVWGSDYPLVTEYCSADEFLSPPPWLAATMGVGDAGETLGRNLRGILSAMV